MYVVSRKFEVDEDYRFIGRTSAEYGRMFGVGRADLVDRVVLGCPAARDRSPR